MLTKERKNTGHFTPSLSPEAWNALKMASIAGTSDKDLAEVYEVTEPAIRKKRSLDKTWAVAVGLKNRALGKNGVKSKHLDSIVPITSYHKSGINASIGAENAAIGAIQATFADESQSVRLLALQIAQKGMKSALEPDGSLKPALYAQEPAHVKVYAEIAAKAGQWGGETQVTVNCAAYAGASVAPLRDDKDESIIDV